MTKQRSRVIGNIICAVVGVFVLAWTVIHSFLGIDLVDTGYYLYQYIYPTASNISYTGFLATSVGAMWLRLFPSLGLWGLNLLELLLEYALCVIVFLTLKNVFRKQSVVLGLAFCMMAISTYVNIFNYHQMSMFFCTAMLCAMLTGLRRNNAWWQLLAGMCAFGAVASRLPSILNLLCVTCIVYWRVFVDRAPRRMWGEMAVFLAGFALTTALAVLVLMRLGVAQNIYNDVFRISNLSGTTSQGYGLNSQFGNLIGDTIHGAEAALALFACGAVFLVTMNRLFKLRQRPSWRANGAGMGLLAAAVIGAAAMVVAFVAYRAFFVLGQAPNFTQLTSYSWFLYGFFFVIAGVEFIVGMFAGGKAAARAAAGTRRGRRRRRVVNPKGERGAIGYMSVALILLCFVGSAARAKHAILGLWLIAPLIIDRLADVFEAGWRAPGGLHAGAVRATAAVMIVVFLVPFAWFLSFTNNFDANDRLALNAPIHSDMLTRLRTTQREADAVNGLLAVMEGERAQDSRLMVIGNAVMIYALAGKEAYVRPWVTGTTYMIDELREELGQAWLANDRLPLIVEVKCDPYDGFAKEDYFTLLKQTERAFGRSSKVKLIRTFEEQNAYQRVYENDYFVLLKPMQAKQNIPMFADLVEAAGDAAPDDDMDPGDDEGADFGDDEDDDADADESADMDASADAADGDGANDGEGI